MSSLTFRARIYLHAMDNRLPVPNGLAFASLLQACRLDYSVQSLARIDVLMDALRKTGKIREETYLDDPSQQNLLFTLAFYVGEVIGRSLASPPSWYTFEEAAALYPGMQFEHAAFENSITLAFPDHPASASKNFLPLVALTARLFMEHPDKSVLFSAGIMLPPGAESGPAAQQPLPPIPPPAWPVDIAAMLPGYGAEWFDMARPPWADNDDLRVLFDNGTALLTGGYVVPGAIVQANNNLTQPAAGGGAPGEVVYDPSGRTPIEDLCHVASRILALKGASSDDAQVAYLSHYLADEQIRVFGLAVPHAVVPYPLKISTTFFDKALLRGGAIDSQVIPLLVSDAHPGLVRPLPAKFWPDVEAPQAAAPAPANATAPARPTPKAGIARRASEPSSTAKIGLLGRMFGRK